jgi:hypothetical protein
MTPSEELITVDYFALGGVGFVGEMSRGEQLTRAIAEAPDAIQQLKALLMSTSAIAQLYATWALCTLEPDIARAAIVRLRARQDRVRSMQGCCVVERHIADLADFVSRSLTWSP